MIADPFREGEKLSYCKHNKIPKVVIRTKYQNEAIRLQDKSKLKQLGFRENRICRDCNERVCCCLWSRWDQRPTNSVGIEPDNASQHNLQRDIVKSWNFRYTILDKFRSSHNNLRYHNRHLPQKHSVIWILKPIKKMFTSETNLIETKKSSDISMSRSTVLKKSLHNLSRISLESKGSDGRVQNWRSGSNKQEFNSTIAKDTKEYFNIRKKKLFEVINAEDQHKKKLIEEELGKRYNELDELSKCATKNAEAKLTTLDILQNTMLRLVRGTDLAEKQKEVPRSTTATKCIYENKLKSSDCALETAEKSLKKLQEGLNELIPAKIKEYNDNKNTLKSKSLQEIKETAEDISITMKLPATKEPEINDKLRNLAERKTPDTQISAAKPKQPHRSKSKISRTRKQRKQKRGKKHSPKKENIKKIMSSTSLILEESQLNFQTVKIEETLSNETITREAAQQEGTESETVDPSPPILFDPSELSVSVNQIYLEASETASNDVDDNDEHTSSAASPPPVITVANGTFSIYFHTPINKNILCKSCGY